MGCVADWFEWPGLRYEIDSPEALAALSSAHGTGIAWLLSQHKAYLGLNRYIDRIHIFNCRGNTGSGWCMYMHIADYSA